jgi:hypothetical protein
MDSRLTACVNDGLGAALFGINANLPRSRCPNVGSDQDNLVDILRYSIEKIDQIYGYNELFYRKMRIIGL